MLKGYENVDIEGQVGCRLWWELSGMACTHGLLQLRACCRSTHMRSCSPPPALACCCMPFPRLKRPCRPHSCLSLPACFLAPQVCGALPMPSWGVIQLLQLSACMF